MNDFAEKFRDNVKRLIKKSQQNKIKFIEIAEEVLKHSRYAQELVCKFIEREDILKIVKERLESEETFPIIIHGDSGSGKTALIAKIAAQV